MELSDIFNNLVILCVIIAIPVDIVTLALNSRKIYRPNAKSGFKALSIVSLCLCGSLFSFAIVGIVNRLIYVLILLSAFILSIAALITTFATIKTGLLVDDTVTTPSLEKEEKSVEKEGSVEKELREAKKLFDEGLITEEEFNAKKKKILKI